MLPLKFAASGINCIINARSCEDRKAMQEAQNGDINVNGKMVRSSLSYSVS